MKERSASSNGKYVAVHLRFEEDMVAFSRCVYDGGKQEKDDMDAARERGWKGNSLDLDVKSSLVSLEPMENAPLHPWRWV
ncbi:hypothetical protein Syun_017064 [Stephania yunnanensis]|uniref:O-fucosyltransferase family protein n=1 Tax=Stephania yunnanensis TaxID=152371 RepID=A0AAP0J8K5_9MAGN